MIFRPLLLAAVTLANLTSITIHTSWTGLGPYRDYRIVISPDSSIAAEQRFLNEGIDLHTDVLKVGHHGSAYSSSAPFIAAVHPKYAVISVGRHNMFGHPAPSTIEMLQRFVARVYRTDENGAVTILTDGSSSILTSMLERLTSPDLGIRGFVH